MLRHLYKTLIISIMCGSLSIMDMAAFAQTAENNSSASSTAPAMGAATPKTPVTRDANGVYKKTESHHFEGTKGKDDNALQILTMIAVGFVGTRLLLYKKWTTDMSIVAAASAAYVAAEIVNIMNLRKQLSDMDADFTKSSDGKIDQAQIETLQKLRESYEKVKSAVKTRKMLQMGAAAMFGLATGVAAVKYFTTAGKLASCEASIAEAEVQLGACIASGATGVGASEATACGVAKPDVLTLAGLIPKIAAESEVPGDSTLKAFKITPQETTASTAAAKPGTGTIAANAKAMVFAACEDYIVEKQKNAATGKPLDTPAGSLRLLEKNLYAYQLPVVEHKNESLYEKALNFFFSKAEAGTMALLGIAGGALLTLIPSLSRTIDLYIYTPGGRIIAWGIMTTAALLGAKASQNEIDKIDDNIKKIDKILAEMNALQKGIKANNVQEQQVKMAGFNTNNSSELSLSSNSAVKTNCLTSNSSSNCPSLENQIKNMPGFSDLPDSFKSLTSQSAKIGDGLSGVNGISGATLSGINSMANNQNAIAKAAAALKSKINNQLAGNKKGKIDFDKEENKLNALLKNDVRKALESKGMSGDRVLASMGLGGMAEAHAKAVASQAASAKKSLGANPVVPQANPNAGKDKTFDLDFKEAGADPALAGVAGANGGGAAAEENYDIGQNDINTNSGESIFQMISNRYLKSGYPKLLEEDAVKK